jgi:hypothetical protein
MSKNILFLCFLCFFQHLNIRTDIRISKLSYRNLKKKTRLLGPGLSVNLYMCSYMTDPNA